MNRQGILRDACPGACCGGLATVPMTGVMLLIQRLLPASSREPQEPRQITDVLLDRTLGEPMARDVDRRRLALTAHFGYGAASGAVYSLVDRALGRVPGRGPAFGTALFALSYAGWLPALGILPQPACRPTGRNALLVASHVVWGATVQALYRRLSTSATSCPIPEQSVAQMDPSAACSGRIQATVG